MAMDEHTTEGKPIGARPVTRRDFLKTAGFGAAALGIAGGLSGALAACGTTSSGGGSSSGGSGGATGRTIKVGFVSPVTGPLAAFGEADAYCVKRWNEAVKDGITAADGTVHPVEILVRDSQSDSNRAATVAGDLVTNDGVDIMMVTSTSDTVVPVADQCEALGTPCVSSDSPWQPFYFGRGGSPDKAFLWTYHAFWGIETNAGFQLDLWSKLKNNKVIGAMWPNDAGRLQDHRRRPLPGRQRGLHHADQQVQGRQRRDLLGRHDPSRLRQLLEAGQPAELPAHLLHHVQGPPLPVRA